MYWVANIYEKITELISYFIYNHNNFKLGTKHRIILFFFFCHVYADLLTFSCNFALKPEEFIILLGKSKLFLELFSPRVYMWFMHAHVCVFIGVYPRAWRRQRNMFVFCSITLGLISLRQHLSQNLEFLVFWLWRQQVSPRGYLFLPSPSALATSIRDHT